MNESLSKVGIELLGQLKNATSKHIFSTSVCIAHNSTQQMSNIGAHPIENEIGIENTYSANLVLADQTLKNIFLINI